MPVRCPLLGAAAGVFLLGFKMKYFAQQAYDGLKRYLNPILSLVLLIVFFAMLFQVSYYRDPLGDDVLGFFENGISFYLDEAPSQIGDRITTLQQVVSVVFETYKHWSGRLTGYFVMAMSGLLSYAIKSFIVSLCYISIVLMFAKMVYGKISEVFCHPLSICVIFILMFWNFYAMNYLLMWTMLSVYGLTVFLCLLYYNLTLYFEMQKYEMPTLLLILSNIFGFFVGLTHEVIVAIFMSMIFVRTLKMIVAQRIIWRKIFFCHFGFCLGYALCFFAPGNFVRMQQSHGITIHTVSIMQRLFNSFVIHISSPRSPSWFASLIFASLIVMFSLTFIRGCIKSGFYKHLKAFLFENMEYLCGGVCSVVLWGVAPHVPGYGLTVPIGLCLVILLKNIEEPGITNNPKIERIAGIVFLFALLILNIPWMKTFRETTINRRALITEAVSLGKEQVVIPAYPKNVASLITFREYIDSQEQYDTPYYKQYYGIHVMIEK